MSPEVNAATDEILPVRTIHDVDPPEDQLNEFGTWLDRQDWTFAKTYADGMPHEYILRKHLEMRHYRMYMAFAEFITEHGYDEVLGSKRFRCLIVNEYKYWQMGGILNRRHLDGHDILGRLEAMGAEPSEYVNVADYQPGVRYHPAKDPPEPSDSHFPNPETPNWEEDWAPVERPPKD